MLRLQETNPLLLNTAQQCAYVLKCLEAGMHPAEILETRFNSEIVVFQVIMDLVIRSGMVKQDKQGNWHIKSRNHV